MLLSAENQKSILLVDLKKLQHNYKIAKAQLASYVECGAVVKANGYGLGIMQVSKALYWVGCRNFFVTYLEEALTIREVTEGSAIYILHGLHESEYHDTARYNFIPVLNRIQDIESYNEFAARGGHGKLPVMINADTGMGRVGLTQGEFEYFAENFDKLTSALDIKYIMSHLACAETPDHTLNLEQLVKFQELAQKFPNIKLSFANSSGIFLGNEYHFDLIRPGIMLYGSNPTPYNGVSLVEPVVYLYGKVLQIKTLEADQTISYGGKYQAKKGDRIATVSCGYGDGYHRIITGHGFCYFEGYKLPIVGIITMDAIMVDINQIPENKLKDLNYVELLGDNVIIDDVAKWAKTISYEMLTSLGNRYHRVYKE